MNILGYNGFDNALSYRKARYQGLSENEYHMCQGLDSSACLLINGQLVAASAEERFTGEKFTCAFPKQAIQACLDTAGLTIDDIDYICHSFDHTPHQALLSSTEDGRAYYDAVLSPETQKALWQKHFAPKRLPERFVPVNHHLTHAAMAFYGSGLPESLVLVADGLGEMHAISVYHGKGTKLTLLKTYGLLSSLGILYSQATAHLGFHVNSDEYKVMGLAPYGDPDRFRTAFAEIVTLGPDGQISVDGLRHNQQAIERHTGRGFRNWLSQNVLAARNPEDPLTQVHKDFAAALQERLENALVHLLNHWQCATGLKTLCMAGGVALNCKANNHTLKAGLFQDIYVPAAADDGGSAIGAAMVQHVQSTGALPKPSRYDLPYLGHDITEQEIAAALEYFADQVEATFLPDAELFQQAAQDIADKRVIAWVQGRMEFGQRALGNRSILADPTCPNMRDRINAIIKKREGFRPFAPAVKEEAAATYFAVPKARPFPHMVFTAPVQGTYRLRLPAITHVDGSARLQTVSQIHAPRFWQLLDHVEQIIGLPMVLNTSFNVKGQPIVRTAEQAIRTMLHAGIERLYIGNYCFRRRAPCP